VSQENRELLAKIRQQIYDALVDEFGEKYVKKVNEEGTSVIKVRGVSVWKVRKALLRKFK